ncbi:hypothetical protein [Actinocatenispora rupis]|uniref:DUF2637 domain-containing protein n=1 Tax=Actinocatenispora rupis TaxID=519421 RepID=A0A8J3NBH4_9ACTN|nr:hypothetical protein [Actinocatenispora rupis]GID13071.1 hypothetical protein Aru02nite_39600 [Actinocatenispora rupis]
MTKTPHEKGRGWAYIGVILGGGVSIAANIAHSYIPPQKASADWSPEPGAVVSSVFWPIALFVALEILTRIPWPTGRGWKFLRFGGLLPVALVAAVVSYRHLSGLLGHYGEDSLTVVIGPLAVDGLMTMATGALLATGLHTRPTVQTGTEAGTEPVTEPVQLVPDVPPAPEPATTDDHTEEAPAFPTLAAWSLPTPSEPARVNGHTPAEVTR